MKRRELALVGLHAGCKKETGKRARIGVPGMIDAPFKVESNGGRGDTSLA